MNTKEIALATNKDERSVRRWIKKASDIMSVIKDKSSVSSPMNPADYNLIETCLIIEQGLGKNASEIFRMNATHGNQPASIESRIDKMESIINRILDIQIASIERTDKLIDLIISNNKQISLKEPEKQLTFNDVPGKSKRAELREIINKYTADRNCNHIEVWSQLYQQIYYRMNINIQLCAKNRGMDKLDYIEKEGLLNEVVNLAKKLFEVK